MPVASACSHDATYYMAIRSLCIHHLSQTVQRLERHAIVLVAFKAVAVSPRYNICWDWRIPIRGLRRYETAPNQTKENKVRELSM